MHDDSADVGLAAPGGDGHFQRITHQWRPTVLGDREPDQPAAVEVDHRRQVQLAFPGLDLSDVANPRNVRSGRVELAVQQVRELVGRLVRSRKRSPDPLGFGHQALAAHRHRHRFHVEAGPLGSFDQLGMDPR